MDENEDGMGKDVCRGGGGDLMREGENAVRRRE